MSIKINITDKRASVEGTPVIVCGNSDYTIEFTFDSEWEVYTTRIARFSFIHNGRSRYQDVEFTGTDVPVPILSDITQVSVGVYAGTLHTTTPAVIPCKRSILCGDAEEYVGEHTVEQVASYVTQASESATAAQAAAERAEAAVASVQDQIDTALTEAKESGAFDGPQGEKGDKGDKGDTGATGADGKDGQDGYTPVKGTDYWTDADIAEIKSYVDEAILGGAW